VKKKKLFMGTTAINEERTISQIQAVLSNYGVTAVLTDYKEGRIEAMAFKINGVPFSLPCRWRSVVQFVGNEDKARRIAWRQIFRWVQAQCALCDTGMVQIDEVFLPYMQVKPGVLFYEQVQQHGANLLSYEGAK
jgi:hypothetical protein